MILSNGIGVWADLQGRTWHSAYSCRHSPSSCSTKCAPRNTFFGTDTWCSFYHLDWLVTFFWSCVVFPSLIRSRLLLERTAFRDCSHVGLLGYRFGIAVARYIGLLPLVLPAVKLGYTRGLALIALWMVTEGHWLFWAYKLEFLGENTFFQIWVASLLFFAASVAIMVVFVRAFLANAPAPGTVLSYSPIRS